MPFANLLVPSRQERSEYIDAHDVSDIDFARSFADVARINRFLGGTSAVVSALRPMIHARAWSRPVRILDIATGSADIPRALVLDSRRGVFGPGVRLEIVATDNHPAALHLARTMTPPDQFAEITVAPADAFALPFADGSFDFALCSLAFHHFGPEQAVDALREMERVSRCGFLVNDLVRDRLAHAGIWALTRAVNAHRFTQHDGPASVLRAFTRAEYAEIAQNAGTPVSIRIVPMYRALLIRDKATRAPIAS